METPEPLEPLEQPDDDDYEMSFKATVVWLAIVVGVLAAVVLIIVGIYNVNMANVHEAYDAAQACIAQGGTWIQDGGCAAPR